jgi:uncharacterized protein (DUF3820 family)
METLPPQGPDPQILRDLVTQKMPFGKYAGRTLCDLPVSYLEWFQQKGFPKGRLGMQLATLYEIKINGLDELLRQIRRL